MDDLHKHNDARNSTDSINHQRVKRMFGKYNQIKKMYVNLLKSTINQMQDGYLYTISMPGADNTTIKNTAEIINMAIKHSKMKRIAVIVTGSESSQVIKTDMKMPDPDIKSEIPVPLPPKIRRNKK